MARSEHSIIELYDLESPYVTEFRRLLYKVFGRGQERELKSLMMTSAMLSEGKSTVCSFMAITAAKKKGYKTLLIDADLRRPSIHRFFKMTSDPGLVEILVDGYNHKDAIQKTSIDKLDVLTSGRRCSNPTEVFDADAIGNLIEELKFYYDLIVVDCPPLLPVSDPMMLASKVDGILVVVKAGATQKEVVKRAVEILNSERDRILGVVLNNMTGSLPYYYDYSYYDYSSKPTGSGQKLASKRPKSHSKKKDNPGQPGTVSKGSIAPNG